MQVCFFDTARLGSFKVCDHQLQHIHHSQKINLSKVVLNKQALLEYKMFCLSGDGYFLPKFHSFLPLSEFFLKDFLKFHVTLHTSGKN